MTSALEVNFNNMRYINLHFTYLLTYLLTLPRAVTEIQRLIGQKSQILPTPLSFSALVRGDPLRSYGKALRFRAADGKDLVILACADFD